MPAHDPAADRAAITAIRDGYAAAFKAGDAAKIGGYMTADAYDMENGMPTMVGGAAAAEGLKQMIDASESREISITSEKLFIEGDVAYDRGLVKTTVMMKGAKEPMVDEGRYLVVLRRQADSSWKLVELIGNSPVPMVPAPPAKK
jgi:ketosteroid isomerase-like protein